MGFPPSVICCGRLIELDKPHILALAAETGFLLFKEQVPWKFKKEISAVQCERKTFRLISLSTPASFRWTVSLNRYTCNCLFVEYWITCYLGQNFLFRAKINRFHRLVSTISQGDALPGTVNYCSTLWEIYWSEIAQQSCNLIARISCL